MTALDPLLLAWEYAQGRIGRLFMPPVRCLPARGQHRPRRIERHLGLGAEHLPETRVRPFLDGRPRDCPVIEQRTYVDVADADVQHPPRALGEVVSDAVEGRGIDDDDVAGLPD